jgi:homocysteine S-methyltransferase
MAALADNPQVVALGINCIALENTPRRWRICTA